MSEDPQAAGTSRRVVVAAAATTGAAALAVAAAPSAWASPRIRAAGAVPQLAASPVEPISNVIQWRPASLAPGENRSILAVKRTGVIRITRTAVFFGVGDEPVDMTGAAATSITITASPSGSTGSIPAGSSSPLMSDTWLPTDGVERLFEIDFAAQPGTETVVTAYLALWYYDADWTDDLAYSVGSAARLSIRG